MARLVLYGPDTKNSAKPKRGMRRYVWYIQWHEGRRRKERSTGCELGDRAGAQRALGSFLISQHRPTPDGPRNPAEIRIADVLSIYIQEHARYVIDPVRIGNAVRALLGYWGDRNVSAISGETCRAYFRNRTTQGRMPGTIRGELSSLRAALRHSQREGYLVNPPGVWLPEPPLPRERWLTRNEVAALVRAARGLDVAKHYMPHFILIGVYTGARSKKAILKLQWQPNTTGGWVDLANGLIKWQQSQTNKRQPRVTPIPKNLMPLMRWLRRRNRQYVLESQSNTQLKSLEKSWAKCCRNASVADATPHTLRHTCGTWMAQRGVPIWQIAGYIGMTVEMASKVYLHHSPEYLRSAAEAIGRKV